MLSSHNVKLSQCLNVSKLAYTPCINKRINAKNGKQFENGRKLLFDRFGPPPMLTEGLQQQTEQTKWELHHLYWDKVIFNDLKISNICLSIKTI